MIDDEANRVHAVRATLHNILDPLLVHWTVDVNLQFVLRERNGSDLSKDRFSWMGIRYVWTPATVDKIPALLAQVKAIQGCSEELKVEVFNIKRDGF